MTIQRICVIGLGYIGLPTAAILATRGKQVVGVDVQPDVIEIINDGRIHIIEPDLDDAVHASVARGFLRASLTPELADVFIIAVPTPFDADHKPDLRYVESASRSIAPMLRKGSVVILESTSPVGTTRQMSEWLAQERPDLSFPHDIGEASDIRIAYCPERVLPGHVLKELVSNDRIIGGLTAKCSSAARALYDIFVEGECILTDAPTAEMCKLTENSFRDVNIAFANELSLICDAQNINVWQLIKLANRHPRVDILQPGPGVGGHCIAVDPWFIISATPDKAKLIRTAREVNDGKPDWVVQMVRDALLKIRAEKLETTVKVALLGLSFKPDIDDLRESPAMEIALKVSALPDVVALCVEPHIEALPAALAAKASFTSIDDAMRSAELLVLLVDHTLFKQIDKSSVAGKHLVDTRGLWTA